MNDKVNKILLRVMLAISTIGIFIDIWGEYTGSLQEQTLQAIKFASMGLLFFSMLLHKWRAGMSRGTRVMLIIMPVLIVSSAIIALITTPSTSLYRVSDCLHLAMIALFCVLFVRMDNESDD